MWCYDSEDCKKICQPKPCQLFVRCDRPVRYVEFLRNRENMCLEHRHAWQQETRETKKLELFFPHHCAPSPPPHPFPESRCFSPWWCLLQNNLIWSDWRHFVLVEDRQLDYLIFMCLRALVCRACARVCMHMHVLNASSFLTSLFTLLLLFYLSLIHIWRCRR